MQINNQELYEAIKELRVVDEQLLSEIFNEVQENKQYLGEVLRSRDLMSDKNLGMVEADVLKANYVYLANQKISQETLLILPYRVAKSHKAIVWYRDKNEVKLAKHDFNDKSLVENLEKKIGLKVKLYYATLQDIENTLNRYEVSVEKEIDELVKLAQANKGGEIKSPIIQLVKMLLVHAENNRTSDIHIEPGEEKSVVRYRIDGVLHDIVKIPMNLHAQIVSRIKVMSKLRTDEHQTAQDGKLVIKIDDDDLDIRVSVVPVTNGEKVVLRLLSAKARQFALADLGMSVADIKKVEKAYKASHGMLLSTGPTGSGKTTSLYGILKKLNKSDVNIMTIEDPVEYDLERVNQIQVNVKTNLTFAVGLRSIVRQDPDIILVGEIRDKETAEIAVNSAMTGHLVLSTLHANNASTTIPRLIDLGIEPFLIASSINVVIGQRLVRKICTNCRTSKNIERQKLVDKLSELELKRLFGDKEKVRVYYGKGCSICHDSGYKDRVGIFEVMVIDDELREMVVSQKDANEITSLAKKNGMTTMLEDGLDKVKNGITTIDEVLRVTME